MRQHALLSLLDEFQNVLKLKKSSVIILAFVLSDAFSVRISKSGPNRSVFEWTSENRRNLVRYLDENTKNLPFQNSFKPVLNLFQSC